MERTNKKLEWRKLGGGSLHWNHQIIKPGQIFKASKDELPEAFMDSLECLSVLPEKQQEEVKEEEAKKPVYKLKKNEKLSVKGAPVYDIVDGDGKVVSEEPLPKKEANAIIEELI